jgi:hypothetical protein
LFISLYPRVLSKISCSFVQPERCKPFRRWQELNETTSAEALPIRMASASVPICAHSMRGDPSRLFGRREKSRRTGRAQGQKATPIYEFNNCRSALASNAANHRQCMVLDARFIPYRVKYLFSWTSIDSLILRRSVSFNITLRFKKRFLSVNRFRQYRPKETT